MTNNGKGHFSQTLIDYLQNGVAERKNRHLLEVARTLLFEMNVPQTYWGESILTTTYLINRMPTKVLDFKSPIEKLYSLFPNF